jgi:hypothetical protein
MLKLGVMTGGRGRGRGEFESFERAKLMGRMRRRDNVEKERKVDANEGTRELHAQRNKLRRGEQGVDSVWGGALGNGRRGKGK